MIVFGFLFKLSVSYMYPQVLLVLTSGLVFFFICYAWLKALCTKHLFYFILMLKLFQRGVRCQCLNEIIKFDIVDPKMDCPAQRNLKNF